MKLSLHFAASPFGAFQLVSQLANTPPAGGLHVFTTAPSPTSAPLLIRGCEKTMGPIKEAEIITEAELLRPEPQIRLV